MSDEPLEAKRHHTVLTGPQLADLCKTTLPNQNDEQLLANIQALVPGLAAGFLL